MKSADQRVSCMVEDVMAVRDNYLTHAHVAHLLYTTMHTQFHQYH